MTVTGKAVVLAHPEALPAEGLTRILSGAGYRVVARVAERGAVLDAVHAHDPAIVLLHSSLLDPDLALLRQLSDTPRLKIAVLICDSQPESAAMNVILSGARGCLSCDDTPTHFLSALRFLGEGATVVSRGCNRVLTSSRSPETRRDDKDDLSVRERQVAVLVGQGATNREIAHQLAISEHTVKIHIGSILNKLNLRNRHQVAAYITRQGVTE